MTISSSSWGVVLRDLLFEPDLSKPRILAAFDVRTSSGGGEARPWVWMECLLDGLLLPFMPGRLSFSRVDIDRVGGLPLNIPEIRSRPDALDGFSGRSTLSEVDSLEDVFSIARLDDFSDLCLDDLFSSLSLRGGDSTAGHFSFSRLDLDRSFLDDFGSGGGVKGGSGAAGGGGGGGIGTIGGGGGGSTTSSLGRRFLCLFVLSFSLLGASSIMATISFSSSSSGNVPGTSDGLRCLLGRSLAAALMGSSPFRRLRARSSRDSFLAAGCSATSSPYCKSSAACSKLAVGSFLATCLSSAASRSCCSAGFSLSESDAGGGVGGRVGSATSSGSS